MEMRGLVGTGWLGTINNLGIFKYHFRMSKPMGHSKINLLFLFGQSALLLLLKFSIFFSHVDHRRIIVNWSPLFVINFEFIEK